MIFNLMCSFQPHKSILGLAALAQTCGATGLESVGSEVNSAPVRLSVLLRQSLGATNQGRASVSSTPQPIVANFDYGIFARRIQLNLRLKLSPVCQVGEFFVKTFDREDLLLSIFEMQIDQV